MVPQGFVLNRDNKGPANEEDPEDQLTLEE